jgi:hypothetical protein
MSYNLQQARNDEKQTLPTGREERTAHRRRPHSPDPSAPTSNFELLPTNVFETPWDPVTPDAKTDSFASLSARPLHYDGQLYTSASPLEQPLLTGKQRPTSLDFSDSKKAHFDSNFSASSISTSSIPIGQQQGYDDNYVFEEFGPVPESANSRAAFLPPPPPRSRMRRSESSWVPATHPWWPETFEPIHWPPLIVLTIVVLIAYPALWLAAIIAQAKSLFWARFIVGCATSVLGTSRLYLSCYRTSITLFRIHTRSWNDGGWEEAVGGRK